MANVLQLKRSATAGKVPTTANLALGELAFNTADGRLFGKRNNGSDEIVEYLTTNSGFKTNVVAATTANITTLAGGAPSSVDGVSLAANDRVLVKNQTTASQNGIYVVTTLGTGSNGTWARAHDCDTAADAAGAMVNVSAGTVNGGVTYTTGFKASDTLGTTAMSWSAVGAGGGVSLSGTNVWTGANSFGAGTGSPTLSIDGAVGNDRSLVFKTAGLWRWQINAGPSAESGANAGSNWNLNAYDDSGNYLSTPITVNRKEGSVYFPFVDPNSTFGSNTSPYAYFNLNAAAGTERYIQFRSAGSNRWLLGANNVAEAGANAGSDFALYNYSDAGAYINTPWWVRRSDGKSFILDLELGSTDAGASAGPQLTLMRDSASPAVSDVLGQINFLGRDSSAGIQQYAYINTTILSPTSGAENSRLNFATVLGGAVATRMFLGADGAVRTLQNAAANVGTVVARHWCHLSANYTLTSTTSAQKLFNTTANGALNLSAGVYEFELLVYVLSMSGTSGNATVSLLGGGTATVDRVGQAAFGLDASTPTTAAAVSGAVSVNTGTNVAVAATGTGFFASIRGMFRVSASGTIIPSITLATAAAAIVQTGSYFKCAKIAESTETYVGDWS